MTGQGRPLGWRLVGGAGLILASVAMGSYSIFAWVLPRESKGFLPEIVIVAASLLLVAGINLVVLGWKRSPAN